MADSGQLIGNTERKWKNPVDHDEDGNCLKLYDWSGNADVEDKTFKIL